MIIKKNKKQKTKTNKQTKTGALTVGFLADVQSQHAAVKIIPFTVPSIHF